MIIAIAYMRDACDPLSLSLSLMTYDMGIKQQQQQPLHQVIKKPIFNFSKMFYQDQYFIIYS
jgi:hypothetical protein